MTLRSRESKYRLLCFAGKIGHGSSISRSERHESSVVDELIRSVDSANVAVFSNESNYRFEASDPVVFCFLLRCPCCLQNLQIESHLRGSLLLYCVGYLWQKHIHFGIGDVQVVFHARQSITSFHLLGS